MHTLILASQSPRRSELLTEAGLEFQVLSINVSETLEKNLNVDAQIIEIARRKAWALIDSGKLLKTNNYIVLSADTVVINEEKLLGKPKNIFEATAMLRELSAKAHSVKTGVCIVQLPEKNEISFLTTTLVYFRKISEKEIEEYVASGEPMDKAGAYGIQGGAKKFVKKIHGSYTNVVGLPVEEVLKVIAEQGWEIKKRK